MRVGLIGSGGREHALARVLAHSPHPERLVVYSNTPNPGIRPLAGEWIKGSLNDAQAVARAMLAAHVDLVVVGPEAPLNAGAVDALRAAGIPSVGPTRSQARLEGDKFFMRDLLQRRVGWGAPQWCLARSRAEVLSFLEVVGEAAVKPLGLTGGKGVQVMGVHLHDAQEAAAYADTWIQKDGSVLLEERLVGEEFSRMAFATDSGVFPMPVAQDFKYAYDGDQGLMTGGMGAYTLADGGMPFLLPEELAEADRLMVETLAALAEETGQPYRGMLYGQFMVTARGVRLIEYNTRFGDPEAINLCALLESDGVELFSALAAGSLQVGQVRFAPQASLVKYLVPQAYPGPLPGDVYFDFDAARARKAGFEVIVSSAALEEGRWKALGSRALALVGLGEHPGALCEKMEALLSEMEPPELRHRRDIGAYATLETKAARMRALRPVP
mgnify:FL=1